MFQYLINSTGHLLTGHDFVAFSGSRDGAVVTALAQNPAI